MCTGNKFFSKILYKSKKYFWYTLMEIIIAIYIGKSLTDYNEFKENSESKNISKLAK